MVTLTPTRHTTRHKKSERKSVCSLFNVPVVGHTFSDPDTFFVGPVLSCQRACSQTDFLSDFLPQIILRSQEMPINSAQPSMYLVTSSKHSIKNDVTSCIHSPNLYFPRRNIISLQKWNDVIYNKYLSNIS